MYCTSSRRLLLLALLLASGCWLSTAARATAADGLPGALEGTWKLLSVESEGEERQLGEDVRWVIQKDKVLYGGEPLAAVTSYPASTPQGLDLAFHEPKKEYEGIYAIAEDKLRVCLNIRTSGPKERPADFSTKEKSHLRVFTFQRISPPDEGPGPVKGFVGVSLALENGQEVAVQSVLDNSPAQKAGLRTGDVILSVGDENVKDLQATVDAVRRKMPGSELHIRVRRAGKEQEIAVKVAIFPFSLLELLG